MLRYLRSRTPRFGFLTLFAAMLLFVSGAGWFKFHFDLWREEEALLADLAEAGCRFEHRRGDGTFDEFLAALPYGDREPVSRLGTWFDRIEMLRIVGDCPRALLERAATFPFLVDLRHDELLARNPTVASTAAALGIAPLTMAMPDATVPMTPLAEGEPLDSSEAKRVLTEAREAWERPLAAPTRGFWRQRLQATGNPPFDRLIAFDGSRKLEATNGMIAIDAPTSRTEYGEDENEEIVQTGRRNEGEEFPTPLTANAWGLGRAPNVLTSGLESLGAAEAFRRFLASEDRFDVPVSRIDADRSRIGYPPITVESRYPGYTDEVRLTAVLRADLDWAVEAWDVRVRRTPSTGPAIEGTNEGSSNPLATPVAGPVDPDETTLSYRARLRREGGSVVTETWDIDVFYPPHPKSPPTRPPTFLAFRIVSTNQYDFGPDVAFEPLASETFDAKRLPSPRTLPPYRWYRVTFATSLALLGFVAVRNLIERFRRRAIRRGAISLASGGGHSPESDS